MTMADCKARKKPLLDAGEVHLVSSGGEYFKTNREVFSRFSTVYADMMMNEYRDRTEFLVPDVDERVLRKVLDYVELHANDPIKEGEEKPWEQPWDKPKKPKEKPTEISEQDAKFLSQLDQPMIFELTLAANFLHGQNLLDLTCMHIANMMKGKTTDQLRKQFGIENDFSAEEEEEVKRENAWAFE